MDRLDTGSSRLLDRDSSLGFPPSNDYDNQAGAANGYHNLGVLAQRLVRTLTPDCKASGKCDPSANASYDAGAYTINETDGCDGLDMPAFTVVERDSSAMRTNFAP